MHRLFSLALFLFSLTAPLFADMIVTRDGMIYKGTIRSATDSTIQIADGALAVDVPKENIIAITFSRSDVLLLVSKEEVTGKVTAKEGDEVVIATSDGIRRIPSRSVAQVRYNSRGEIKVSELPATGKHFTNPASSVSSYRENSRSVFVSVYIANHYASLQQWKDQFTGGDVQTQGPVFGAEAGYVLSRTVTLAAGYEAFSTPTLEIRASSPTFDDHAAYSYLYGSLMVGGRPSATPEMFIYGGVDLGSLKGSEVVKNFNGIDFDVSGTTTAYRLKAGMRYMTSGWFELSSELGYLAGKVSGITVLGRPVNNYALDFSGVFFRFGIAFHITTESKES